MLISIAVPYPIHWGVAAVWKKKGNIAKTWIADCGDPFMGQENDTFKKPFYFKYIEKWFCRKADYLTVPTSGSIKGYYKEFHPKIRVIPQGFRFEDFSATKTYEQNNCPCFAYAGMFIPGRRDPRQMLEYLLSLTTEFKFYIYTSTPELVKPYIEKSNEKIVLLPPIPRDALLIELSKMDFVVNFENIGNKQTPSKLIDYTIIKKPILSLKSNELNTTAVNQFLAGNYIQQLKVENPNQYRIENVAKLFLKLLN